MDGAPSPTAESVPSNRHDARGWYVVVAGIVALIVVGVWWFMHDGEAFNPSWGSDTNYHIVFDDETTLAFANGIFAPGDAQTKRTPQSTLLPERVAEAQTASFDPRDYETVLENGVHIPGAMSALAVPESTSVLVRRIRDIALCEDSGVCTTVYSFGTDITAPVSFSVTNDRFVVLHPFSGDVQVFTFSPKEGSIAPVVAFPNPVQGASWLSLDPMVPGRIVFASAESGETREVVVPLPVPEGVEPRTERIPIPTTLVSVCYVSIDTGGAGEPVCVRQPRDLGPRPITAFMYE